MAREYHVAKSGNDQNLGTYESPFLTISKAAKIAEEGDTVIVHEGVYRECVSPEFGSRSAFLPITYVAAEGEKVVIKGSEEVGEWKKDGDFWCASVKNTLFGGFNPYAEELDGDWLVRPLSPSLHTGMVYYDGEALREALTKEMLRETEMSFFAEVKEEETVFSVNLGNRDPNTVLMEVNVRRSCFYPEKRG